MGSIGSRLHLVLGFTMLAAACSSPPPGPPVEPAGKAKDSAHAGITAPHGDHTAHHGGMVLMNGETHYEVVFDKGGKHRVWFSDAVREELPASIASGVVMVIRRPMGVAETLPLAIDESGESWVAAGAPLDESGTMVTLRYSLRGQPFEIEVPFVGSQ